MPKQSRMEAERKAFRRSTLSPVAQAPGPLEGTHEDELNWRSVDIA
jgi:hypothetical protein